MSEPTVETATPVVDAADFVVDTQVRAHPSIPGRYVGEIPQEWRVVYAFGGVSLAVALRALLAEIARDDLALLSANAIFCAPVPCGAIEVDARSLRSGRSAAQGTAELRVAGSDEPALVATATLGTLADSPIDYVDATFPPAAGDPADHDPPPAHSEDDPFPPIRYHEQTDWRPAIGTRPWEEGPQWEPGPAEAASWHRPIVEPTLADGSLDPLALCLPADAIGGAVGQRLGPDGDNFFTVTLEMGIQFFREPSSAWILQHLRAPQAADGYAWGFVDLYDLDRRLVATGTQRARLRAYTPGDGFFDGPT